MGPVLLQDASHPHMNRLLLIYAYEPEELGGEGDFVLAEQQSAVAKRRAFRARTWGGYARVAGKPFAVFLDEWGDEVAEAIGRKPRATEPFNYADFVGAWFFADLVEDPRQVAYDEVLRRPTLRDLMRSLGFEFQGSPMPGWAGVECIVFSVESCVETLEGVLSTTKQSEIVRIHRNDRLIRESLVSQSGP